LTLDYIFLFWIIVPPKSNEFSMVITQNQQEQYDTQFTEESSVIVTVNGKCLYIVDRLKYCFNNYV
jgi:hypothetical protein